MRRCCSPRCAPTPAATSRPRSRSSSASPSSSSRACCPPPPAPAWSPASSCPTAAPTWSSPTSTPTRRRRIVDGGPRRDGDAAAVLGWTPSRCGSTTASSRTAPTSARSPTSPALRWQVLGEGRFPDGPGEVVADVNAAKGRDVAVGDQRPDRHRPRHGRRDRRRRSSTRPSASVGAQLYLTWPDLRGLDADLWVDRVAYAGPGASPLAEHAASRAPPSSRATTFVEDRQAELDQRGQRAGDPAAGVRRDRALRLGAGHRQHVLDPLRPAARDFALLRCVGATRRQVLRSVRVEAVALGVVSPRSASWSAPVSATASSHWRRPRCPAAAWPRRSPSLRWYAGGTGRRRARHRRSPPGCRPGASVRVSPLAALRPDDSTRRPHRRRPAAGRCSAWRRSPPGPACSRCRSARAARSRWCSAGSTSFSGVLLLGPVLVPALIRAVGGLAGRVAGAPVRLATENAVRNPRRTAATTASLLVGVTLTTAVLTGLASSRSAVDEDLDRDYPRRPDAHRDRRAPGGRRGRPGARGAGRLRGGRARRRLGRASPASAGCRWSRRPAPTAWRAATRAWPTPRTRDIWLPDDLSDGHAGDRVTVRVDGRSTELRSRGGEGWGEAAVVAPATLAQL